MSSRQREGRLQGSTTPLNFWIDEYGYQTDPPDKARGVSLGATGPLPAAGRLPRLAPPARAAVSPTTCGTTRRWAAGGACSPAGSRA